MKTQKTIVFDTTLPHTPARPNTEPLHGPTLYPDVGWPIRLAAVWRGQGPAQASESINPVLRRAAFRISEVKS
jgi:hypothetical protein